MMAEEKQEEKEKSLKEKVDELYNANQKKRKVKKLKPRKAKVSKGKRKKGYVAVMKIHENRFVDFQKVPIEESAYKLKEDTYHALRESGNLFFFQGKYPLVIQPTTKKNPYNPLEGKNETKGQKHIMNLMLKSAIKGKGKKMGNIVIWIIAGIVGIVVVQKLLGG